jgi:pimeloyl-ACP methyl ester carboxylesterase
VYGTPVSLAKRASTRRHDLSSLARKARSRLTIASMLGTSPDRTIGMATVQSCPLARALGEASRVSSVAMPQAMTREGVSLAFETYGSPTDPPVLMVMGFGTQLIGWPRGFCRRLASGGRFVISFDNRDCGLSTKFDRQGAPLEQIIAGASAGDFVQARDLAAYTLNDMAVDGFGLLSALGIKQAHVVGTSMGGMIAQTMAIEHPEHVLTLTSMMSSTGEEEYGQSEPEALRALLTPAPGDRNGYVNAAESWLVWRSKRYPDLAGARALAAESYDRCYPLGSDAAARGDDRQRLPCRAAARAAGPDAGHPRAR